MQAGKYELISRLAIGGMAEVFLARAAGPMGFEKTLVLKRILPHLAEDPAFVEMFLSEARLAAQLNHPNIVQIFDFGEIDGEYFLAMEYIDGPNLRALVKKALALGMQLPPALCARIIASACEGLAFAHELQDPATGDPLWLIHRDISTDNILVSRQGAVKLVDFGIAKAAGQSHKTRTGVIKGKVAYMAPEQIRARVLDLRVDVYALGVVFYELLTGRKPYNARTEPSLMQAILFEPLVPASHYRPDLPEALQRILDRALAKDREERYPNCRALQIDLEEFILSTGKPMGAWQISQLVTQLAPPPASMIPAVARSTEERPTQPALATPAPSPALRLPTSSARTLERVDPPPRHSEAPTLPMAPAEVPESSDTVPALAPASMRPAPEVPAVLAMPSRKWLPALMGVAVLIAGGGYLASAWTGHGAPLPTKDMAPPGDTSSAQSLPTAPEPPADPVEPPAPSISEPAATEAVLAPLPAARPVPARANRANKQAVAARTGTLRLVVRGWAEIWVDGQKKGRVPPVNELELPAGRHQLTLINPSLKPYRATITIASGETLEHRVIFQATEDTQASIFGQAEATRLTTSAHQAPGHD